MRKSLILLATLPSLAFSQTRGVVLNVAVSDGSTGSPIANSLVSILDERRISTRTGGTGLARLTQIDTGSHMLRVRALGYAELSVLVTIAGTDSVDLPVQLRRLQILDSVKVSAVQVSPWLREFEERRRRGTGRYISTEEIRSRLGSDLASLLAAKIGTIRVAPDKSVLSQRGPNGFSGACRIVVYLDGFRVPGAVVGDIGTLDLAGVEYYTPSQIPVQYKAPVSAKDGSLGCGVLLLWTGP